MRSVFVKEFWDGKNVTHPKSSCLQKRGKKNTTRGRAEEQGIDWLELILGERPIADSQAVYTVATLTHERAQFLHFWVLGIAFFFFFLRWAVPRSVVATTRRKKKLEKKREKNYFFSLIFCRKISQIFLQGVDGGFTPTPPETPLFDPLGGSIGGGKIDL